MSSVVRSLEILEAILSAPEPQTHGELARKYSIPKSTLSKLLETLQNLGYLRAAHKRYLPGPRLLSLGYRAVHTGHIRGVKPFLDALAERTGETVLLGIPVGDHVMYVEQSPSSHAIRFVANVGELRPMHCTAMGRVFLAFGHRSARTLPPGSLVPFTSKTLVDPDLIDQELERVRRRGFALNEGESVEGVSAIAAPLIDSQGMLVAAISVTGPAFRVKKPQKKVWPALRQTIRRVQTAPL